MCQLSSSEKSLSLSEKFLYETIKYPELIFFKFRDRMSNFNNVYLYNICKYVKLVNPPPPLPNTGHAGTM